MSARAIRSRLRSEGGGSDSPGARLSAGSSEYSPTVNGEDHRPSTFTFPSFPPDDGVFEVDGDTVAVEVQLAALQEQLVAVMLENQHLNESLKSLRDVSVVEQLRQQLEREKEKSRILAERFQERDVKERVERDARDRERTSDRDKSLPPGDKSPSLPQRIRQRINQIHKSQSFDVENASTVVGPSQPVASEPKMKFIGEESTNGMTILEPQTAISVPVQAKSPSRGRFGWKKRGLEKSKSLDQSEFLASLGAAQGDASNEAWILTDKDKDKDRRESDSDEGGGGSDTSAPMPCSSGSSDGTRTLLEAPSTPTTWFQWLEHNLARALTELAKDFSEVAEEEQPVGDPEGDPLTVKKLKENILRFGYVMRPLSELSGSVFLLLRWESPSATFLALVAYMYSVYFGWVTSVLIAVAIFKLSVNYMKKRGWSVLFLKIFRRRGDAGEPQESSMADVGLGDKFALVLQVARKVQNQLGAVSDAAEKCKNLFMWEHEATRQLYLLLWLLFLASLFLPSTQLLSMIGLYMGVKLFIIDYLFSQYPRIRAKYDSTSRLWDTLPTDADLDRRADRPNRHENGSASADLTSFLELFSLPSTEAPLPGWQSGKRCTLVNRDRSLTSAFKNGRLYLTNRNFGSKKTGGGLVGFPKSFCESKLKSKEKDKKDKYKDDDDAMDILASIFEMTEEKDLSYLLQGTHHDSSSSATASAASAAATSDHTADHFADHKEDGVTRDVTKDLDHEVPTRDFNPIRPLGFMKDARRHSTISAFSEPLSRSGSFESSYSLPEETASLSDSKLSHVHEKEKGAKVLRKRLLKMKSSVVHEQDKPEKPEKPEKPKQSSVLEQLNERVFYAV